MIEESEKCFGFVQKYDDENLPISFYKNRHVTPIENNNAIQKSWRIRERMKTVSVALVVCLNVGVDPPDVFKITPCSRLECWIDPSSVSPQKAMEMIGANLQKQYERWQPRARYKQSLDPTVEDVKKLCTSLRRNAKEERVLFHYNGHGVPRPTVNGEIWVFNRTYTQYIPLSIYDLQTWMGAPSVYVYDCSNAGIIVNSFNQFAEQHEREMEQLPANRSSPSSSTAGTTTTTTTNPTSTINAAAPSASNTTSQQVPTTKSGNNSTATSTGPSAITNPGANTSTSTTPLTFKNCIQLAACAAHQILPMNPQLPADLFTSCLTTPIKMSLKWFTLQQPSALTPQISNNLIEKIPGLLNDRRTMLGELNWIFTAITDTIAWNVVPRDLFQKLFRQDLLLASLFRNFLLAERIMRSYDCTPISSPALPPGHRHPMWAAWDLTVDLAIKQLPNIVEHGAPYISSPFFEDQLTAFHVWLERGSAERNPPEQLPIVLQVLLSQNSHRVRALELLGRFLDLGPWAVHLALSVGIFPYVLKLLQAPALEIRPLLVFIWAKILAVDNTCQVDLIVDQGHKYFLSVLQDSSVSSEYRTLAAFVLASIVHNFPLGQVTALQSTLVSVCLVQIYDPNMLLRQWCTICLGQLWQNYDRARWSGVRDLAHEKLNPLLLDPVPEVRAAAVYALGTFIGSVLQHADRTEHANNIDRSIAMTLLHLVGNDMSPIVRMELIAALQWIIILFENQFVAVFLQEPIVGSPSLPAVTSHHHHHHTNSLERNINIKRVSSSSSLANMSGSGGGGSLNNFPSSLIGFGSTYTKIWQGLNLLCRDPYPCVGQLAHKEIDFIVNQAVELISAKEATKENFGSSFSLPPSPNTRTSYLSESPPPHINHQQQSSTSPLLNQSRLPQPPQIYDGTGITVAKIFSSQNCNVKPPGDDADGGNDSNADNKNKSIDNKTGDGDTNEAKTNEENKLRQRPKPLKEHLPAKQLQQPILLQPAAQYLQQKMLKQAKQQAAQLEQSNRQKTSTSLPQSHPKPQLSMDTQQTDTTDNSGTITAGPQETTVQPNTSVAVPSKAALKESTAPLCIDQNQPPPTPEQMAAEDKARKLMITQQQQIEHQIEQQRQLKQLQLRLIQHQQKMIVQTNYIPWSVSFFSSPSSMFREGIDCHSPEYLERMWRFQRNENVRKVALEQQRRAIFNRPEIQIWGSRTQYYPYIVKQHPYEMQIAVAYKNKIMVNDWSRSTVQSYVPAAQLTTTTKSSIQAMSTGNVVAAVAANISSSGSNSGSSSSSSSASYARVSALEFINGHDKTLIMAGYDDGCIRIWRPYVESSKENTLVTAWQALTDITSNKFQSSYGLVLAWQQKSQTIIVGGDTKHLRLFDAETELKLCDIPTGTDSAAVRVLTTAPNEIIAAGCTDGSVRLFDKRCAPTDARVMTYRETSGAILTACLRDDCENLITGCSQGSIRFFDVRRNYSLSHWFADGEVNTMAVHTSADILACGTNCITVYGLDGRLLSTLRPHGFMGPKSGATSALSFHPLKISLAAGFLDNTVAVYVSDTKRH